MVTRLDRVPDPLLDEGVSLSGVSEAMADTNASGINKLIHVFVAPMPITQDPDLGHYLTVHCDTIYPSALRWLTLFTKASAFSLDVKISMRYRRSSSFSQTNQIVFTESRPSRSGRE